MTGWTLGADYQNNHIYNKILKSDWLSTVLISALIGQYVSCLSNWIVRDITRVPAFLFFTQQKNSWNFLCFDLKKEPFFTNSVKVTISW